MDWDHSVNTMCVRLRHIISHNSKNHIAVRNQNWKLKSASPKIPKTKKRR